MRKCQIKVRPTKDLRVKIFFFHLLELKKSNTNKYLNAIQCNMLNRSTTKMFKTNLIVRRHNDFYEAFEAHMSKNEEMYS